MKYGRKKGEKERAGRQEARIKDEMDGLLGYFSSETT